jgi:dihydropteroate synthase
MGILNVTPDSFSDGGEYLEAEIAVERAAKMVAEGVDIIDVGGESSRPGAAPVDEASELQRVVPVIRKIAEAHDIPISIDTTKSIVAEKAIEAGAHIINDIGALRLDPRIAEVASGTGAGLVLMHMQKRPRTMQEQPHYERLMPEIVDYLATALRKATRAGVDADCIVVDPGIGFGKAFEHNWQILRGLEELQALGRPILLGTSRKSFLKDIVGGDPADLEAATLATCIVSCLRGARVIRVHDVRSHRHAMEVVSRVI